MSEPTTIYVVDDDEAVLLSVKAMLSQHGYESRGFLSAEEFLAEVVSDLPGCVVTDLQMPNISGVELQQRLLEVNSVLSVVVVTGVADVPTAVKLMERGALTLLEKPYNHTDLIRAVERALTVSRERWLQRKNEQTALDRLATLTDQERRVMECMLTGQPNKTIAHRLQLSMRTVDRRRQAVLEKIGVRTVPELALLMGNTRFSQPHFRNSKNISQP